ncbi:MAG: recombination-associated protein RdgC [Desulfarculales bacterium]|jgi:hypothetical protein|nr:recombination-associated protein RdgC [Desulfarculales bacterium]
MSLLKGMVSLSRYKAEGNLPSDFWSWLNRQIIQNGFMDIEGSITDKSLGWVSVHDYFDVSFSFESYNLNPYVCLSLRQDKRTISAALVRKYHRLEINRMRESQPDVRLSKPDREMLKEKARLQLLNRIPPQTTTWELCWHTIRGEVWLTTGSRALLDAGQELFQKSFAPLRLIPLLPWMSEDNRPLTPTLIQEKSTLGQEFLTWLWWMSESGEIFKLPDKCQLNLTLGERLSLSPLFGHEGSRVGVAGKDQRMAEAREALRQGKLLDRLRLGISIGDLEYWLTLDAVWLSPRSVRLPSSAGNEEQGLDSDGLALERLFLLEALTTALDQLFTVFLQRRPPAEGMAWPKFINWLGQ